jgi:kumamolisin
MAGKKIALAGSDRAAPENAAYVGDVDPDERIVVALHLKRRSPDKFQPGSAGDLARLSQPMTRGALVAQRERTHARAAARVRKFAKASGLDVRDVNLAGRVVTLEGSARQMSEIFGARLCLYDGLYDGDARRFRARIGQLMIPSEIAPWTRAILGFDQRPLTATPINRLQPLAGAGAGAGLWPTEVAALYGIPLDHDTSSVCVGIIALGGGYLSSDLAKALTGMQRENRTAIDQSVSGSRNTFGGGTPADQEIALDLQIIAGLLPKARIVVYFAPNTIQSLVTAISQAIFDDVNRPQVLSVSWGSAEKFWTAPGRDAMQAVLADAQRLRVNVVFASGDELATAGLTDGKVHVWFPASSPYALGCGGATLGATLETTLGGDATSVAAEAVWNEGSSGTGGGISDVFPVPAYQLNLALPPSVNDGAVRRGVPDVAGAAAGTPGYRVVLNGAETVKDGTSAVAPLWAALIAIANAQRGTPLGFVNSVLYSNPSLLRPIIRGNNRADGSGYDAGPGWNACTGLGVPRGADIIAALAAVPIA